VHIVVWTRTSGEIQQVDLDTAQVSKATIISVGSIPRLEDVGAQNVFTSC